MTLKDEDLRRLYRSYVARRTGADRKACPSWKDLSDFFETRSRAKKKLKIVDHVTACAACAEEFEFLRQVRQFGDQLVRGFNEIREDGPLRPTASPRHIGIAFLWRYSSVATGIMLVLASLTIIIQKWNHSAVTRAAPAAVILIFPAQKHPAFFPLTFKWEEFKGAEAYILELFDEALMPVWKSPETGVPYLNLPEEVRRRLPSNRRYFWMITAYRSGERLAESALVPFMLNPKSL